MALATKCQTPGAQYTTEINTSHTPTTVVSARVDLPFKLRLGPIEAIRLESNIHNALELVLAPYFVGKVHD